MMDDSAPTDEERKLVKTYKNVLPQKRIVATEACGETYSKRWLTDGVEKHPQTLKQKYTPQIKEECWEREIKNCYTNVGIPDTSFERQKSTVRFSDDWISAFKECFLPNRETTSRGYNHFFCTYFQVTSTVRVNGEPR